MTRLITLTTDFGADSHYVAQMKAAILSINPDARIVDVTHSIPAQNVAQAARLTADVCPRFPAGSIHVIVVDPGVGTSRRIVLARVEGRDYIAPDNGLLSMLTSRHGWESLREVSPSKYWAADVSATFHGRDIMAPVAAHLSRGVAAEQVGPPIDELTAGDWPLPRVEPSRITGQVVLVDKFGNLISDIAAESLEHVMATVPSITVACRGQTVVGLCGTYGDRQPGELIALFGSSGNLELAVVGGNAAEHLVAGVGEKIELRW